MTNFSKPIHAMILTLAVMATLASPAHSILTDSNPEADTETAALYECSVWQDGTMIRKECLQSLA